MIQIALGHGCFSFYSNVKWEKKKKTEAKKRIYLPIYLSLYYLFTFLFTGLNYSETKTFLGTVLLTMRISYDFNVSWYKDTKYQIGRERSCTFL